MRSSGRCGCRAPPGGWVGGWADGSLQRPDRSLASLASANALFRAPCCTQAQEQASSCPVASGQLSRNIRAWPAPPTVQRCSEARQPRRAVLLSLPRSARFARAPPRACTFTAPALDLQTAIQTQGSNLQGGRRSHGGSRVVLPAPGAPWAAMPLQPAPDQPLHRTGRTQQGAAAAVPRAGGAVTALWRPPRRLRPSAASAQPGSGGRLPYWNSS